MNGWIEGTGGTKGGRHGLIDGWRDIHDLKTSKQGGMGG